MKIILDGGVIINGSEFIFKNMSVGIDGDIEIGFGYDEKNESSDLGLDYGLDPALISDLNSIETYDFEDENDCLELDLDEMITDYTNALLEGDLCPDCIRSVLESMAIELLFDEDTGDTREY